MYLHFNNFFRIFTKRFVIFHSCKTCYPLNFLPLKASFFIIFYHFDLNFLMSINIVYVDENGAVDSSLNVLRKFLPGKKIKSKICEKSSLYLHISIVFCNWVKIFKIIQKKNANVEFAIFHPCKTFFPRNFLTLKSIFFLKFFHHFDLNLWKDIVYVDKNDAVDPPINFTP